MSGTRLSVNGTRLHVVERGGGPSVIVLHGGPGLDHRAFGDYLDPLAARFRLLFVDQRGHGRSDPSEPEHWTLTQLAADVGALASALELDRYAVLGHSFGAFVALQHAVDTPSRAVATIVCAGVASTRHFSAIWDALDRLEPPPRRERVRAAMAREREVRTPTELRDVHAEQMPFFFADPDDPRIAAYEARSANTIRTPAVLRHYAARGYGGIEVEDQLSGAFGPMLVVAGRHDPICPVAGGEAIAAGAPDAELLVLERSGHFPFVEQPQEFLAAVERFLAQRLAG